MRNITGYWIGGYCGKLNYETTLTSEIRAIYYGIKLGHDEGLKNIEIERSSEEAIQQIMHPTPGFEQEDIVSDISELFNTFDSCVLNHVPESSNQLAISVAMYSIDEGCPIFVEEIRKMRAMGDCVMMRLKPKVFTDSIRSLSEDQQKWVRDTGFGSLLYFKMEEYPMLVLPKTVSSYDPNCSSLKIKEKTLIVTENSVHENIGLPRGSNTIQIERNVETICAWRSQFGGNIRQSFKITGESIYEAIKSSNEVNLNFKLNFMVLLSNLFFKGSRNPYVILDIIGFNGDLDNCNDYNWCEYLVSCLNSETSIWNEKMGHVFYTGSIAFLIFFYMDSFADDNNPSMGNSSSYMKWTDVDIVSKLEEEFA